MVFGFGAPNVEGMEAKRDVIGLVKALSYKKDLKYYYTGRVSYRSVEALGRIGDPRALEPLIGMLESDVNYVAADAVTRARAAQALGEIGDSRAVEPLIRALDDTDNTVSGHAAIALGDIGDTRAVDPLIKVLNDYNRKPVRGDVVHALCKIGDARTVGELIRAFDYQDDRVRRDIVEALGEIGDDRGVRALAKALNDPDRTIGELAEKSLVKMGSQDALEALALHKELFVKQQELLAKQHEVALAAQKERFAKQHEIMSKWSDQDMLRTLQYLCDAYAKNDERDIARLEPQATQIGEELNYRGGREEMCRIFELLGNRRGSRTLDMHWDGIGDWRG